MRKSRILICLGAALAGMLIVLAVGVMRWLQFVPLLAFQKDEALYAVPNRIPRRLNQTNLQETADFQAFGCFFDLPWQPISDEIRNEQLSGLIFGNGEMFLLHNPHSTIGWLDEFKRPENAFVLAELEKAYGKSCCDSVFDIVALILNATPERLSFFRSLEKNSADALLLTYKRMYLKRSRQNLSYFQYQNLRGYQIGETTDPEPVQLLIFPHANIEVKADIRGLKHVIPQAEIDAVLAGFRFEPTGRNWN